LKQVFLSDFMKVEVFNREKSWIVEIDGKEYIAIEYLYTNPEIATFVVFDENGEEVDGELREKILDEVRNFEQEIGY